MRGAGAQTRRCAGEHHAQTGDSSNKPRLRCRSVLPSHRAYCARRCPVRRCRCQSSWTQHNQIDEHNKTRCVCHSRSTCAEGSELTESLSRSSSLDKRLRTSGGDTESLALALAALSVRRAGFLRRDVGVVSEDAHPPLPRGDSGECASWVLCSANDTNAPDLAQRSRLRGEAATAAESLPDFVRRAVWLFRKPPAAGGLRW